MIQIQLDLQWLNAVGSDTSWTRSEPAASIAKREASCASGILGESEVPHRGIPHQELVLSFGGEVPQFGKPTVSLFYFISAKEMTSRCISIYIVLRRGVHSVRRLSIEKNKHLALDSS